MYKTKNFSVSGDAKFACSCCGEGGLSIPLLIVLEVVRAHFGLPVTLTSGARCVAYNKSEGGSKNSEHICTPEEPFVEAADIRVQSTCPRNVYDFLNSLPYANLLGLGDYSNDGFTHVDTRGYAARW